MAGPVKFVCFIASTVIVWGLFAVGEIIVAWLDYKINGNCIPCHLELFNSICHLLSIFIHGLLLHGIRKETTRFMFPWMFLYKTFAFTFAFAFPVAWIPNAMILYNFWFNHFDISRADNNLVSLYVIVSIYGEWVEEIYESNKEKGKRQFDEITNIEEGKETKEGEKNSVYLNNFVMMVKFLLLTNAIHMIVMC